ncbi:MAG: aminotransferase class V-fold PLP-dependent enzyme, partial [Sedimentisphaerales bacterium]|nr:aminotransferase class V-fold PLP-dependent enzyme [Sedimentisphaerales bacterium]
SLQDVNAVGKIARDHEILYLVDAAQSIGHYPVNAEDMNVDFLAFPGHKGLLGPLGTGVLYIKPGREQLLRPLKEGGTGSRSEDPFQPQEMPDKFEGGSHNALGIAGLSEGVGWLIEQGQDQLRQHDVLLCREFLKAADAVPGLTIYGPRDIARRLSVFSVSIDGYTPVELSKLLESQYGLLTRPGLHCAPFAHKAIGSFALGGTSRFSCGMFNTVEDVRYAVSSLIEIASKK